MIGEWREMIMMGRALEDLVLKMMTGKVRNSRNSICVICGIAL